MFDMDFHPQLETPGVDAETQIRLRALVRQLTMVVDEHGREEWRGNSPNFGGQALYRAQASASGEEQYLASLLKETNPDERQHIMHYRLKARAELVAAVLAQHEDYVRTRRTLQLLAAELQRLQALLADQPAGDNRLAAFCVGLAGLIRQYKRDYDARDEMAKIKGVEINHVLEAVNVMFDTVTSKIPLSQLSSSRIIKPGTSPFNHIHFLLGLIRTTDATLEHANLIASLDEALKIKRMFENRRRWYHDAKSRVNRPQFAQRLEAVLLPVELQPEWVGNWNNTFESIKQQQADAEATYFAEGGTFGDWYALFKSARAKLTDALAASAALLTPERNPWSMDRIFDTEAGIATYKAIVNCIHARGELGWMDELYESGRKTEAQMVSDFQVDTMAYVTAAVELGSQPIPAIIPTPNSPR